MALGIISCKEEIVDVHTSIEDHTPFIQYEWTLSKVTQKDEKAGPGKLIEQDISAGVLSSGTSELSFEGNNFTASGVISDGIGSSGTWELDDVNFPTKIITTSEQGTTEITLGESILSFSEELVLKDERTYCEDGTLSTSYLYVFEKK